MDDHSLMVRADRVTGWIDVVALMAFFCGGTWRLRMADAEWGGIDWTYPVSEEG